jgi:D-glucosaminate-6-phosphate ammonia-lyase
MKVSKEDIIGVLTAVEHWFEERGHAAERQKWYDDLAVIAERIERLPGARGDIIEPSGVDRVPLLRISWGSQYMLDGLELRRRVLDGEPRIMLDDNSANENSIEIDPFQLQPGEAVQVGDAVSTVLREARSGKLAAALSPLVAIAGDWELHVDFLQGSRVHRLNIEQRGAELSGHQRSAWFEGPVSGRLSGEAVQFSFNQRYEGSNISYLFDGTVGDGQMGGTVALGAATDHHAGIVNRGQFGTGHWQASRVA